MWYYYCSVSINKMKQVGLLLVLVIIQLMSSSEYAVATKIGGEGEIWKPAQPIEYRVVGGNHGGGRRRLEPFQLCLSCKCCAGSNCATMPCCFGIDCQLPNKPYGVCAFVPKTCNCSSCAT